LTIANGVYASNSRFARERSAQENADLGAFLRSLRGHGITGFADIESVGPRAQMAGARGPGVKLGRWVDSSRARGFW
jgi:hypothetical protein